MNTETEPRNKSGKWEVIFALIVLAGLFGAYYFGFHTSPRVYTRENTGLERLPLGVAIPMMPDGSRVDYVKAYELIYPRLCENPEENGWREVVRTMGLAVYMWNVSSKNAPKEPYVIPFPLPDEPVERKPPRTTPPTEEEWELKMAEFARGGWPGWEEYCRKLALAPESLTVNKNVTDPELALDAICWRLKDEGTDYDDLREIVREKLHATGWSAEEYPEMAAWVAAHEELLDLVAAAVRRERYILPFFRCDENTSLLDSYSGDVNFQYMLARGFCTRATMRMEGVDADAEKILADVESLWRLARHMRLMPWSLTSLNGMAIEALAKILTIQVLEENLWNAEQLKMLAAVLDSLPTPVSIAEVADVDHWIGYEYIDAPSLGEAVPHKSLRYIDMTIAAERFTEVRKGLAAEDVEERLENIKKNPFRGYYTTFSVRERSKSLADLVACLVLPAVNSMIASAERTECYYQLARLAVSLKRYQAQHGEYPETLDALVPAYLAKIPEMSGKSRIPDHPGPRRLTYIRGETGFTLMALPEGCDPEALVVKEYNEEGYVIRL